MSSQTLPLKPSRDNHGGDCDLLQDEKDNLPDHVTRCSCQTHAGVCETCGGKVTIGSEGVEYGHQRATNRSPNDHGVRRDCPHRPMVCNPGGPQAWDGYDRDEWNARQGGDSA